MAVSYQQSAAAVVAEYLPGFESVHVSADIKLHNPDKLQQVADPAASLDLNDRVRALDGVVRVALADGVIDGWDRQVIDWACAYLGLPSVAIDTLLRQANIGNSPADAAARSIFTSPGSGLSQRRGGPIPAFCARPQLSTRRRAMTLRQRVSSAPSKMESTRASTKSRDTVNSSA